MKRCHLLMLCLTLCAGGAACSNNTVPSSADAAPDGELPGVDGCQGDLPVADLTPGPDQAPTMDQALDHSTMDIVVADGGTYLPHKINHVCPPTTIAADKPYSLKVRYHVWCLGARPSKCKVTVKGNTLHFAFSLRKSALGCDASDASIHDATCVLPALTAGTYSFVDAQCSAPQSVSITVGPSTTGSAVCKKTACGT